MRFIGRAGLAVALVYVFVTGLSGAASAASLSISPGGAISATSLGRVTFAFGALSIIECDVQLVGSLSTGPAEKVAGVSLGEITATPVTNCNLGISATPLFTNGAWQMRYVSISGTLPNDVTGMRAQFDTWQLEISNVPFVGNCLYAGRIEVTMQTNRTSTPGEYTAGLQVVDPSVTMALQSGAGGCPATGTFRGTFTLSPTQTITRF